jgi:arabinogalactan oligomer/maltooligosaccharide transport system substrate-binding protein
VTTSTAREAREPVATSSGRSLLLVTREEGQALEFIRARAQEYATASGWNVLVAHKDLADMRLDVEMAALAGTPPALIWTVNSDIAPLAAAEVIQPMDGLIDPAAFDAAAAGGGTVAGKVWGVPVTVGNHLLLLYNKTLLPSPPKTTAELQSFTRPEGADVSLAINRNDPLWLIPWLHGYGGHLLDAEGRPSLNTPGMVDALKLLKDLREKSILVTEADFATSVSHFKIGRVAMIVDGDWSVASYADAAKQAGFELGIARLPLVSQTNRPAAPFVSGAYVLLANGLPAAERDAAKGFVAYLTSPPVQARLAGDLKRIPALSVAQGGAAVQADPLRDAIVAAMANAEPLPARPEMRAIWDALLLPANLVLRGEKDPEEAAREMQAAAEVTLGRR